ncbi:MAG: DUF4058 family protein [Chitinophagaceae bacterium]|nr:DUF4058 family protein [Anaerolineae bacterium]
MHPPYSVHYLQYLMKGPFPSNVDPWAEDAAYFHQIHNGMISNLARQLGLPLARIGYSISKEPSLQIAGYRKPDVVIESEQTTLRSPKVTTYTEAAAALQLEPGVTVDFKEPELDAIYIRRQENNQLITVIEIISPRNKTHRTEMLLYQEQRTRLFLEQDVNVVEMDVTRSVQRLFEHHLTVVHDYHTAIFIPGERPRLLVTDFPSMLKPLALPLWDEAIAVNVQNAYEDGYREAMIAQQIRNADHYTEDRIPFSTLLTSERRAFALEAVAKWQAELEQLRQGN